MRRELQGAELVKEGQGYYLIQDGVQKPLASVTTIVRTIGKDFSRWAVGQALLAVRSWIEERGLPKGDEEWNALFEEAKKAPYRKAGEAASRGTQVHAWLEGYLQGVSLPPPPGLEAPCRALAGLMGELKVRPIAQEFLVAHPEEEYAGTVDLLAEVDGRLSVVDYKVTRAVYPEHHLQVGAYALALRAEGYPVERGYILHFERESGESKLHPVELEEAMEAWLGLVRVWRFLGRVLPKSTPSSP